MTIGDNPFDVEMINVRERPLSSDVNQQSSLDAATMRFVLQNMLGFRSLSVAGNGSQLPVGAVGDGFKVDPGSGMHVQLRAGLHLFDGTSDVPTNINGCLNLNDTQPLKPGVLTGVESITVPTADPTNPRWDIVEVKYSRQVINPQSRGILNLGTGVFDPTLVDKTMSFNLSGLSTVNGAGPINYKTGTPAGSPAVPSTDAGYVRIGRVYVPAAAGSITSDLIIDDRRLLAPGGALRFAGSAKINHSTFAFQNVQLTACPPGCDIAIFTYSGSSTVGIQIVGPFPNIGASQFNGTIVWNVFPNVIGVNPGVPFVLTSNFTSLASKWLPAGATTAIFPTSAGPGTNNNVLHNSFYNLMTPMEWNGTTFVNPTDDFIVTFEAIIPVI